MNKRATATTAATCRRCRQAHACDPNLPRNSISLILRSPSWTGPASPAVAIVAWTGRQAVVHSPLHR